VSQLSSWKEYYRQFLK